MRLRLTLLSAVTVAAAGGAVLLAAPAANAIKCPQGTRPGTVVTVAGHAVQGCVFYPACDPGPCTPPPTAVAPQD